MLSTILMIASIAMATTEPPLTLGDGDDSPPRYEALPGKAVGVIVWDGEALSAREGRSGPPGATAFLRGDASFRWMYLPAPKHPDADDLEFGVGADGKTKKMFSKVSLATREMLGTLGMRGPFQLVEVEVNGGAGSPPEEAFVATTLKRLDGTQDFPLKPAEVLRELLRRARAHAVEQRPAIDKAIDAARAKAAKGRKPTGPEEISEAVSVTWLPKEARLRIEVRRKVTNGFYAVGQGVEGPKQTTTRTGTQFGAVGGVDYRVDGNGKIQTEIPIEYKPFTRELPPLGLIR